MISSVFSFDISDSDLKYLFTFLMILSHYKAWNSLFTKLINSFLLIYLHIVFMIPFYSGFRDN